MVAIEVGECYSCSGNLKKFLMTTKFYTVKYEIYPQAWQTLFPAGKLEKFPVHVLGHANNTQTH